MGLTHLLAGPTYVIKGFDLIRRPGLRRFVVIPLMVNVILFSSAIWLSIKYFGAFMTEMLPHGFDWLLWLLWPLFAVSILLVTFFTFTLVANLICAPFNGLLAEAVEREITGTVQGSDTSFLQAIRETPASIWNEIRKLGYFLSRAMPLLLLFIIPGINLIAPVLWIAFTASLLAKEYLDYPMANHNFSFTQQRDILKQHRLGCMSFGGSIMLLSMIPVVNFIVMPLAVAGATGMYLDKIQTR